MKLLRLEEEMGFSPFNSLARFEVFYTYKTLLPMEKESCMMHLLLSLSLTLSLSLSHTKERS
jgi:hypothetical protein